MLNQARIYGYGSRVRSRVTTANMSAYFLGGSAGSGPAVALYPRWGWTGICAAGGALTAVALLLWATEHLRQPSGGGPRGTASPQDRPRALMDTAIPQEA